MLRLSLALQLGVDLFLRRGRSIVASEAGRCFYVSVHQAFEILEEGARRARELQLPTISCVSAERVAS